jgi:hypothetical protein
MHPTPLLRPATLLLATLAGLSTSNAPAQSTRPSLNDTDSAIAFVFKQTALSRQRIKSATYTVKFNTQTRQPDGTWQQRPSTQTVLRDGAQFASTWDTMVPPPRKISSPAPPDNLASPLQSNPDLVPITFRVVRNNSYMAYRGGDENPIVYVYDHLSIAQQSDESRSHSIGMMLPDMLLYGFGDGSGDLGEWHATAKTQWRWTVDDGTENGHHVYTIKLFSKDPQATMPRVVYTIDADQGFLITTLRTYMRNGAPVAKLTVFGEPVGPDQIICPAKVLDEHYPAWNPKLAKLTNSSPDVVVHKDEYTLGDIKINEPVSAECFTVNALKVPANKVVLRTDISNVITPWRILDGKLVTEAQAKSLGAPPDVLHENIAAAAALDLATARETIKANRSFLDKATSMPQFAFEVLAVAAIALATRIYAVHRAQRKTQSQI